MFRLAGLHPGADFDGHAIAALAGTTLRRATGLLTRLTRAHLVQPRGPGRYGMHDLLRDSNALVRDYAEQALWALWSRSGDPGVDRLMVRGVEAMQADEHGAAIAAFSEVVKRKPSFAEGWNKRATVYYLTGEYEKSIADCAEVLKRNPRHFGALAGLGQIYMQLQRYDEALKWLRQALEVNPNLLGVEFNIKSIERLLAEKRGKSI